MVGLLINVSGSDVPGNDGEFIITAYVNSGKVETDSPSLVSDVVAQATINFC